MNVVELRKPKGNFQRFKELVESRMIKTDYSAPQKSITKALYLSLDENITSSEYIHMLNFFKLVSGVKNVSEVKSWLEV